MVYSIQHPFHVGWFVELKERAGTLFSGWDDE